jgi:hypothetical protein
MIAELLNREVIEQEIAACAEYVQAERDRLSQQGQSTAEDDALLRELAKARAAAATTGPQGFDPPESDRRGAGPGPVPLDDIAYISSDVVVSLVQSAAEEYVLESGAWDGRVLTQPRSDDRRGESVAALTDQFLGLPAKQEAPDDRRLFEKFSITDARWVRSKIAEGIRCFRGKHAFNPACAASVSLSLRTRRRLGQWFAARTGCRRPNAAGDREFADPGTRRSSWRRLLLWLGSRVPQAFSPVLAGLS